MKKLSGLVGFLVLSFVLASPALADDLGQKIAAWCGEASPGNTLGLTDAESATYDQHTSEGYNFSEGTRFEFEEGVGYCTTTYTSNAGDEPLATDVSALQKNGNILTMGSRSSR